jgi:hypothetical protein
MVSFQIGRAVGYNFLLQSRSSGGILADQAVMKATRGAGGGAVMSSAGERHVLSNVPKVSIGDQTRLAKGAFAFPILALKQVPCTLFPAQDLSSSCDLEAFGDSLPGLCFS